MTIPGFSSAPPEEPIAAVSINGLGLVASTGIDGYTLQNAEAGVISWLVPDDGNLHRVIVSAQLLIGNDETGGAISVGLCDPGGVGHSLLFIAPDQPALIPGVTYGASTWNNTSGILLVAPSSIVSVYQSSALIDGTATLWAEIWGL